VEWISYWKPNITLGMLDHFSAYPLNQIPPQVRRRRQAGVHRAARRRTLQAQLEAQAVQRLSGPACRQHRVRWRVPAALPSLHVQLSCPCHRPLPRPAPAAAAPQLRPQFHLNDDNNYFPLIGFEEFWMLKEK